MLYLSAVKIQKIQSILLKINIYYFCVLAEGQVRWQNKTPSYLVVNFAMIR